MGSCSMKQFCHFIFLFSNSAHFISRAAFCVWSFIYQFPPAAELAGKKKLMLPRGVESEFAHSLESQNWKCDAWLQFILYAVVFNLLTKSPIDLYLESVLITDSPLPCTEIGLSQCTILLESCRPVEAEMVSNSRNKVHQTWSIDFKPIYVGRK